jgi:hypothetical protein
MRPFTPHESNADGRPLLTTDMATFVTFASSAWHAAVNPITMSDAIRLTVPLRVVGDGASTDDRDETLMKT